MTATQVDPASAPRGRTGPSQLRGRSAVSARRDDSSGLLLATEFASFAVTVSAIAGMHLLFDDASFFGPLLFQALLAHLVISVIRRMRVRLLPAALIVAGAAALAITWTQYLDTSIALLPSPDTLSAIDLDMDSAWQEFRRVKAPAPVLPGFIVATSVTIWVIVFISDWGAFRTGVSFEALLPQATLFLFAAVLGADGARAGGAAFFVATALVFLLLHRTWRQEGTATWAALHRQRGRSSLLLSGCVLTGLAVVGGGVFGPNLPGADDEAIVGWREFTKNHEPRRVISPLVDIRKRLIDQSDQEFFSVRVEDPTFPGAYWRMTALDEFTGEIWKSTYQTKDADGDLDDAIASDVPTTPVEQTITIADLGSIWLPAAFEPAEIDTEDDSASVDYDRESSTLIVDNEEATSDGMTYTVVSDIPNWTYDQLRDASQRIPQEVRERYLDLPTDFSPRVTAEAQRIVEGHDNRWDQAVALMNYFRVGDEFEYSLDAADSHSESAIEDFLFESKSGYCEQFAGSYAAMARAVDIPARVVVGFTAGQTDVENDPGLFRVTGKQAHAWVEVYFEDYGWITVDPTKNRAPDGAEQWMGPGVVGGQQAENAPADDAATDPGPTATLPQDAPGGQTPPNNNGGVSADAREEEIAAGAQEEDDGPIPEGAIVAAKGAGVGLLTYVLLVPILLFGVAYLRRRTASTPEQKVRWAWQEVSANAVEAGVRLAPSLTPFEAAGRLRTAYPNYSEDIDLVAGWVEQVSYAEHSPSPEEADEAMAAGARVATTATQRLPLNVRVLRYLDIRRLLPRTREARRSAHGAARTK